MYKCIELACLKQHNCVTYIEQLLFSVWAPSRASQLQQERSSCRHKRVSYQRKVALDTSWPRSVALRLLVQQGEP